MPAHISNLGDIVIRWSEDQPAIRVARIRMEQDGTIRALVKKLETSGEDRAEEKKQYQNSVGDSIMYICLITRCPERVRAIADHRYVCHIKRETLVEWGVIGDVYVKPFPESIAILQKEE